MTERERQFMEAAINLAREGMNSNTGGPFGCVVVKDDAIIGRGCNSVLAQNDPTAHAEVVAIRDACTHLKAFQLEGCEIYTSCEPCPMCMGAIYWARPRIVYFANNRHDAANIGFDDSMIYEEMICHLDKRKIPILSLGREAALEVFREWQNSNDKTVY